MPTAALPRFVNGLFALALAVSWLVAGAVAAGADEPDPTSSPTPSQETGGPIQVTITQPGQGATVEGTLTVTAEVNGPVRQPNVSAQLAGTGRSGGLGCSGGGVGSPWTCSGSFDISGVRGGDHTLAVDVRTEGERTGRAERAVKVPFPPLEATIHGASVVDEAARAVEVTWGQSSASGFEQYVIERQDPGGSWHQQHITTNQAQTRHVDTVPASGDYQYRLTVRAQGQSATSGAVGVSVGGGGNGDGDADPEAGGGNGNGQAGSSGRPSGPGGSNVPSLASQLGGNGDASDDAEAPRTAPRDGAGLDMFEPELDYGEVPEVSERDDADREVTFQDRGGRDDGQLTVSDRQLQAERVLVPVAAGLVLTLGGLHVRRFLNA
jgi:hypothetical protein